MFALRHSNRLSSRLEQKLRVSSTLMPHFFLSAVYITRELGENDVVFEARDRDFLSTQNLNFWSFWQTRFLAKQTLCRRRGISARRDADRLSFGRQQHQVRAYRRLICCYPPRMSRETWVGTSMAFSSSMSFFLSYLPGMHVVVFTQCSSVSRTLASTPICCSILQSTKRIKPSADTWAIDPWVRVVPCFLSASLFQNSCAQVGDDVFLVATLNLFHDIYQVPHTSTRGPLL